MLYALVFAIFAAYLAGMALLLGGVGWLLLWPAVSFALLGLAYALREPRLLGKRPDGRVAGWACLLFLPYFLLSAAVWHGHRLLDRRPACQELAPGLWIGRRLFAHELPSGVGLVMDLTAEFPEPAGVRKRPVYRSLPTLDGTALEAEAFRAAVAEAAAHPDPVFVHCALGHGRTGTFAAAVLLARGLVADARDAERTVRAVRPGVRLKPAQRRLLEAVAAATPPEGRSA
jgi:protein-tyrosine phosphatase